MPIEPIVFKSLDDLEVIRNYIKRKASLSAASDLRKEFIVANNGHTYFLDDLLDGYDNISFTTKSGRLLSLAEVQHAAKNKDLTVLDELIYNKPLITALNALNDYGFISPEAIPSCRLNNTPVNLPLITEEEDIFDSVYIHRFTHTLKQHPLTGNKKCIFLPNYALQSLIEMHNHNLADYLMRMKEYIICEFDKLMSNLQWNADELYHLYKQFFMPTELYKHSKLKFILLTLKQVMKVAKINNQPAILAETKTLIDKINECIAFNSLQKNSNLYFAEHTRRIAEVTKHLEPITSRYESILQENKSFRNMSPARQNRQLQLINEDIAKNDLLRKRMGKAAWWLIGACVVGLGPLIMVGMIFPPFIFVGAGIATASAIALIMMSPFMLWQHFRSINLSCKKEDLSYIINHTDEHKQILIYRNHELVAKEKQLSQPIPTSSLGRKRKKTAEKAIENNMQQFEKTSPLRIRSL